MTDQKVGATPPGASTPPGADPAARRLYEMAKSVVLYGKPKTGKTLDLAVSVPNLQWILARPDNLFSYQSWLDNPRNQEEVKRSGLRMWNSVHVSSYADDMETSLDVWADCKRKMLATYKLKREGKLPNIKGVVIDELSELFSAWVSFKGGNMMALANPFAEEIRWLLSYPEKTGLWLFMICHESEPNYEMVNADEKGFRQKRGDMIEAGGAALPFKKERVKLFAGASVCLRRIAIQQGEAIKRVWITQPSKAWYCGGRADTWKTQEERSIGDLLRSAGNSI